MPKKYHIRDLEEVTGIKAHTIRMWEKRYDLIAPDRSDTNIRYYDESEFKKFLLISQLYHNDYKISDIAKLSVKELQEKALLLNKTNENYEAWASELFNSVLNFDSRNFDSILKETVFAFDFSKTSILLLLPFLHKIDVLWKSESLTYLHRQFAFESAYRFMYSAIYSVDKLNIPSGKKVLLYTDIDEMNYFKMMFSEFVFKKQGFLTTMLTDINDEKELFANIGSLNVKYVVTVAHLNKKRLDSLVKLIEQNSKITFYIIDTNYVLDVDLPNLIIVNVLDELEDEIV